MREILRKVHVNIPFQDLLGGSRRPGGFLEKFIEWKVNPEIGLNYCVLDAYTRLDFGGVAQTLTRAGLHSTVHFPFMDLRPGAVDPKVRDVTQRRLIQAAGIAQIFKPSSMVGHASFEDRYYVSSEGDWLKAATKTWGAVINSTEADGPIICLENVYESGPGQIRFLLEALNSPRAGFCLDTGHLNVFSDKPLELWMKTLGRYLREVHLHDNNGKTDEHLPIGAGNFPFQDLFRMLKEMNIRPVFTLEPHREEDFWKTLKNVKAMGLDEFF